MNRTQRAIKKQYRQSEAETKRKKRSAISILNNASEFTKNDKFEQLKKSVEEEKDARKLTINYKITAKNLIKEVSVA